MEAHREEEEKTMTEQKYLTLDIDLFSHQQEIRDHPARYRIVDAGRRWGKTKMAVAIGLLAKPNTRGWIVAPTYKLLKEDWMELASLLPSQTIGKKLETDKTIELKNNIMTELRSADNEDDGLRGAGLDWCIIDEASRVSKRSWEYGIRPALSDKRGKAIFISTPKGRNWFYDMYVKGQDPHYPNYKSWKFESRDNPYFPTDEWETAKNELPADIFAQEFQAEFLKDEASALKNIDNCIKGDVLDINDDEVAKDRPYIIGADLAKFQDFTVMIVVDKVNRHVVGFERFQHLNWDLQKHRIRMTATKYFDAPIAMDATGVGDPIYDDLIRDGLDVQGYKFTNTSKVALIQELMINLEMQKISFPELPELINELKAYEYEILPGGKISYHSPKGGHDDCVIALALAVHGLGLEDIREDIKTVGHQFPQFGKSRGEPSEDNFGIKIAYDHSGKNKGIPR